MNVWSPVELFSRENLREYQFNRLKSVLSSAYNNKLYKDRFDEFSIDLNQITSVQDISKLPFTSKEDLVRGYEDGCFKISPEKLYRWHRTSGSTGTPVRVPDSFNSWEQYGDLAAAALYGMGVRREDVAFVCFGYGPFIAFWSYIAGLDKIGSCFVPGGALSSTQRVEMIASFGVNILFATPTYTMQLAETASNMGIDLSKYLRLTIHTGEPCTPVVKKRLRETVGVRPMDRFGTTETGGIAFECSECPGIYHIQENHLIAEVIDPETKEATPPGKTGELIITPLYRTEVPVIRFRTQNLVKLSEMEKCTCGRTMLSLEETRNGIVIQRLDNLVKVRGVLINPAVIGDVINEAEWISEYMVVIEHKDRSEEVNIKAELRLGAQESNELIKNRLEEALKNRLLIRCNIELVEPNTLPKFEEKAKRLVDLRK
ncbi:MAG: phenylacetate--CoA ligase family protein [Syntrophorhabdus sp.]